MNYGVFHNALYVNEQLQKTKKVGGEYVLAPTKSGRSRMITVAPSVMHLLKKQKRQQAQMRLLAGQDWENPWDLVFTYEHAVISLTSWCTRPSKRS